MIVARSLKNRRLRVPLAAAEKRAVTMIRKKDIPAAAMKLSRRPC